FAYLIAVVRQLLDADAAVEATEEGRGDIQTCNDDFLARVHFGAEVRVGIDCRGGGHVAAAPEILTQHARDEIHQIEGRGKRHHRRLSALVPPRARCATCPRDTDTAARPLVRTASR